MELDGLRDLVRKAQAGDPGATAEMESRLRPFVARCVRRRAGPAHPDQSVSDWAQDVWQRFLETFGQFRGADEAADDAEAWRKVRAWVAKIVRSVLANAQRHRARHEPQAPRRKIPIDAPGPDGSAGGGGPPDLPGKDPTPSKIVAEKERLRLLSAALERLPDADRELVRRYVFEKQSWKVIAGRLGRTVDQVKYRYRLILGRLKRELK
jgi:RNA polymerase sigma factor (sigma-70 family)